MRMGYVIAVVSTAVVLEHADRQDRAVVSLFGQESRVLSIMVWVMFPGESCAGNLSDTRQRE